MYNLSYAYAYAPLKHETHHPGPDAYPDTATIFIHVFILIQDIRRC
jgi:hypothetical protein